MTRERRIAILPLCVIVLSAIGLSSCFIFQASGTLQVRSFDPSSQAKGALMGSRSVDFTTEPTGQAYWVISGTPEYLKVTLTSVAVVTDASSNPSPVWQGSQDLLIQGSGKVNTSALALTGVPAGNITRIILRFNNTAKIKGSLQGILNMAAPGAPPDPVTATVYTKAAYAYDASGHAGGADSYTAFTAGPAEETDVTLGSGGDASAQVETPASITVKAGDAVQLTILVDLSRMLCFYDGHYGQGVSPSDPADKAFFYSYSVFGESVAAFFGDAGSIQGYSDEVAAYDYADPVSGAPTAVGGWGEGWMTIVLDQGGNIMAGALHGDHEWGPLDQKGIISSSTTNGGAIDFTYSLLNDSGQGRITKVSGFKVQSAVGSSAIAPWEGGIQTGTTTPTAHGETSFTLQVNVPVTQ